MIRRGEELQDYMLDMSNLVKAGRPDALNKLPDVLADLIDTIRNDLDQITKDPMQNNIKFIYQKLDDFQADMSFVVGRHNTFVNDMLEKHDKLEEKVDRLTRIMEVSLKLKEERQQQRERTTTRSAKELDYCD